MLAYQIALTRSCVIERIPLLVYVHLIIAGVIFGKHSFGHDLAACRPFQPFECVRRLVADRDTSP